MVPLVAFLFTGPVDAWPADTYRYMVYDTLRLMPPSLARILRRNDEHLLNGVARLEGEIASTLARHGRRGELSAKMAPLVESRVSQVVEMVNGHRPFREIAFELGKLLRITADLADPVVVGAGEWRLARASTELYRFMTLHLEKIPLVYDRSLPSTLDGASVGLLLEHLTTQTDESVVRLADAFWRDGRVVLATEFDFRSVPYAEVSLGYSRGVTAASFLWLSAWSKANGDFTGYRFMGENPSGKFMSQRKK